MLCQPTLQQALVVTGLALASLSEGYIFGQMSGMINVLRADDSPITLSENEVSWIASIINVTCIIGFAIVIVITELYGRKITLTIVSAPVLICWLMIYFAKDKYTILASRIIVGIAFGSVLPLIYMNVSEYVGPNKRIILVNFITCGMGCIGTMLGHILSIFLDWKNVALIGMIPTALSTIMPLFWVESPFWLANSGRYEDCERSFRALHRLNETSTEELKQLINNSRQNIEKNNKNKKVLFELAKSFIVFCRSKYFFKFFMIIVVISTYRVVAGKILLSTLANVMIQDITGSKNIFSFTLLVDGFALAGTTLFCFFISNAKLRPLLLISGTIANCIQIALSTLLYCFPKSVQPFMTWLQIILLALYFITVSGGPYSVLETLLSEIHPLKTKAITLFMAATIGGVLQFLDIKVAYVFLPAIGYQGVFLVHSAIVFLCLLYMYFYLPETRGKTLQEIEMFFEHNKFHSFNVLYEPVRQRDIETENIELLKK
ncbi:uncharacterized protein LOC116768511 [Danaus plexippus]|uniref:uncharacterized protein LOC116768511 n=1 Tax=Danaus plexippus TaxID=13037 RepID=UPI002AB2F0A4|nr:uncharacterized protein LOC116768511 [Danaus plexippus]